MIVNNSGMSISHGSEAVILGITLLVEEKTNTNNRSLNYYEYLVD